MLGYPASESYPVIADVLPFTEHLLPFTCILRFSNKNRGIQNAGCWVTQLRSRILSSQVSYLLPNTFHLSPAHSDSLIKTGSFRMLGYPASESYPIIAGVLPLPNTFYLSPAYSDSPTKTGSFRMLGYPASESYPIIAGVLPFTEHLLPFTCILSNKPGHSVKQGPLP